VVTASSDTLTEEKLMTEQAMKKPLVVTTSDRGVFFGYGVPGVGESIVLDRARMVIYWPEDNHGVTGLAVDGPKRGSRVTQAAPAWHLRNVTSVMEATDAAAKAWESEPWSR
jgi:hypothetical protein